MGLYHFKARWFDSQLGRFAQADTLLADPFSPFDYDRYQYVHNNSIRFTDPTGNRCENAIECAKPRPSQLDRKKLGDQTRGKTGINGLDFYGWYKDLYADKTGWWWNVFGMDDEGFTIWDAIAVVLIGEAQGYWKNPYLSEAAIRAVHNVCGSDCTIEDQINRFAAYSQTAGSLVRNRTADHDPRGGWVKDFDPGVELALNRVSAGFTNQPEGWQNGCTRDRPCGWGNNSPDMYTEEVRQKLQTNQTALFAYYPSGATLTNNPWFIPSFCVVLNWLSGDPLKLNATCPVVR